MSIVLQTDRIHRAVSRDGTQIAGRVVGDGPPLVLVHGGVDDGDTSWGRMLPHLADRFTCHLPSTRGRGLSGDHPDHSPDRLVDDVVAYAESVGEPVGLAGESSGGMLALGAAARTPAVAGVVAYEPLVPETFDEEGAAQLRALVSRVAAAVGEGRLVEAAEIFLESVATEEELPTVRESGYLAEIAPYVPVILRDIEDMDAGTSPTDPQELARIAAPVLLLYGSRSATSDADEGGRHVTANVAGAQVRVLEGLGHAAPAMGVPTVAEEIAGFLLPVLDSPRR